MNVKRLTVEKKTQFATEARNLEKKLANDLGINNIRMRIINVYDIEGSYEPEDLTKTKSVIFSEANTDIINEDDFKRNDKEIYFRVETIPGQYNQRADSARQAWSNITLKNAPDIITSKIYGIEGDISEEDLRRIKNLLINPVEAREVSLAIPNTIKMQYEEPAKIKVFDDFTNLSEVELAEFKKTHGLAMSTQDLKHIQNYYSNEEKRNPTVTEIKVIDTYWSDHCRHTTFGTILENVEIEEGLYTKPIKEAFELYQKDKRTVNNKPITLMDIATLGMKKARLDGKLTELDVSDEINACTVNVDIEVDGQKVPYSIQFKNETHNHPTEIEPFGGAATCLGGVIRDPLSGRSYVYQAMRVTGAHNPNKPIEETLKGKLPQKTITLGAASGYSSYGNQIGLPTGSVTEYYHPGFEAKRMEVGAVIGAAPKENIVRETPKPGDLILLIGGRTGRDGIGGATGSSKEHTVSSIETCGAEVQKGNPVEERKIQVLFKNPEVTKKIKKCNDFGAGGVAVAIGELADSLVIDLDAVPKKYEGLDGTEIAISESQERMAVVINEKDLAVFQKYCHDENVECTVVAKVTDNRRLIMNWQGETILDISRAFLNTNGATQTAKVKVTAPESKPKKETPSSFTKHLLETLSNLNVCSQQGLVEMFDSTIGANTVLMPFGGKHYKTPTQTMCSKIPTNGQTNDGSLMSHGYNPNIGQWSPFHSAIDSIISSVAKLVASGANYEKVWLTLQEYFERLGTSEEKWGKPFAALLGAYYAQSKLGIYALGGKDSMSGSFEKMNVPPTLISFAVAIEDVNRVISPELKTTNSHLYCFNNPRDEHNMPNFELMKKAYSQIHELIKDGKIKAAYAVEEGGVASSLCKMAFGNKIGFDITGLSKEELFEYNPGSIIVETTEKLTIDNFQHLGKTNDSGCIKYHHSNEPEETLTLEEALNTWEAPLNNVFPITHKETEVNRTNLSSNLHTEKQIFIPKRLKPSVAIPVFPGTNCELDTARAFNQAGANINLAKFINLTPQDIEESITRIAKTIKDSQILALPGGFSAGDEPDGSAKFMATILRNPQIQEAIMEMLNERDGLILGICNGFQGLIKTGLVPYGEFKEISETDPTLTHNLNGRHISRMIDTKIISDKSPWLYQMAGEINKTPISHGEGRFYADNEIIAELFKNGQVATQYVDLNGNPTYHPEYNPNGSCSAIEGITSPDGRILGKMGHNERMHTYTNVEGTDESKIFRNGICYFTGEDPNKPIILSKKR